MDNYAIHTVIIQKTVPLDEAKKTSQDIIKDNTKTFYRETKNTYRFRNISKQKFEPKTFRTKKIRGKPISIVFGKLKKEYEHLKGKGILDFFKKGAKAISDFGKSAISTVKETFSPRLDDYSNSTKNTLNMYGNKPVMKMTIYRTPIAGMLNTALNFVSLGKWNELREKYGFDRLFHLAIICTVGNKNIVIEKNEVINVSTSYKTSKDTEIKDVPLNGRVFTISEMLGKARQKVGDKKFFDYDAFNNNCQYFIKYLLEAVGLYSKDVADFVFQDLSKIYEELPSYVSKVAKTATTTGAVVSKLTGQGEKSGSGGPIKNAGTSKKAGFIRALMAKKFDKDKTPSGKKIHQSSFKKYLETGFQWDYINKASLDLVFEFGSQALAEYISEHYEGKVPTVIDIKPLWLKWLDALNEKLLKIINDNRVIKKAAESPNLSDEILKETISNKEENKDEKVNTSDLINIKDNIKGDTVEDKPVLSKEEKDLIKKQKKKEYDRLRYLKRKYIKNN